MSFKAVELLFADLPKRGPEVRRLHAVDELSGGLLATNDLVRTFGFFRREPPTRRARGRFARRQHGAHGHSRAALDQTRYLPRTLKGDRLASDHLRNALGDALGDPASTSDDDIVKAVEAERNDLLTPSTESPRGAYLVLAIGDLRSRPDWQNCAEKLKPTEQRPIAWPDCVPPSA